MNDKIKINLQMAGASYPLTINREDEEMVREAAKQVDIRLNAYREHYQNVSLERIIAMVAYQFALENLQLKDIMLGAELNLPHGTWLRNVVFEYLYTKYQR